MCALSPSCIFACTQLGHCNTPPRLSHTLPPPSWFPEAPSQDAAFVSAASDNLCGPTLHDPTLQHTPSLACALKTRRASTNHTLAHIFRPPAPPARIQLSLWPDLRPSPIFLSFSSCVAPVLAGHLASAQRSCGRSPSRLVCGLRLHSRPSLEYACGSCVHAPAGWCELWSRPHPSLPLALHLPPPHNQAPLSTSSPQLRAVLSCVCSLIPSIGAASSALGSKKKKPTTSRPKRSPQRHLQEQCTLNNETAATLPTRRPAIDAPLPRDKQRMQRLMREKYGGTAGGVFVVVSGPL